MGRGSSGVVVEQFSHSVEAETGVLRREGIRGYPVPVAPYLLPDCQDHVSHPRGRRYQKGVVGGLEAGQALLGDVRIGLFRFFRRTTCTTDEA